MNKILEQYENLPQKLFSFIIYIIQPYKWKCISLLLFVIYLGLHISLEPYSLKLIINNILSNQGSKNMLEISYLIAFFVFVRIMHSLSAFGIDTLLAYIHPGIKKDIGAKLLNNFWYHTSSFYEEELSGSIASKIEAIQNSVCNIFDNARRIFRFFLEILFACLFASFIHPIFIIVIIGWTLIFILFGYLFSSRLNLLSYKLSESSNDTFGKIVDIISNIFTIKIFHSYWYENRNILNYLEKTSKAEKEFRILQAKSWIVLDIFCLFLSICMIILLIKLMNLTVLSAGDFAFIIMLSLSLTNTVFDILEQFEDFINNVGSAKQSLEVFFKEINTKEINANKKLLIRKSDIEFKDVYFQYNDNQVFKKLSIRINNGERVGLVGVSGSGKSTFVKLILRLIEPTQGKILIDNTNIIDVSVADIMCAISFVPQDPLLFHRSIRENIRYGNPESSDEDIETAAKKAFIHDFIITLPNGYETLVGEKGIKLSGGQRQRIAMARAFLKSSEILVMDEATSSLDTITENDIQKSLLHLTHNKTSLIIAHRLSTVSKLDRILVFDEGSVIEDGKPSELLENDGVYKKLWSHSIDGLLPERLEEK